MAGRAIRARTSLAPTSFQRLNLSENRSRFAIHYQVLVFQGLKGAPNTEPVAYDLSAEATAMAFGQLDEDTIDDMVTFRATR